MTSNTRQRFCYLFEAKGIQRYIFDSGSLRDLIGASDLVAELAHGGEHDEADAASPLVSEIGRDLIGRVLDALGSEMTTGQIAFSRRASAAVMLHADDAMALHRIRALLRLTAGLRCPGLEMSDTCPIQAANDIEALSGAYREASALRINSGADLPPAGHPVTAFNPRTGRVATRLFPYRDDIVIADGISEAQRLRADRLQGRADGIAKRYLESNRTDADRRRYVFPRNLDPEEGDDPENPLFPFDDDDHRIGVVHADISGLGQIWRGFNDPAPAARLAAARAIEKHVEGAAQRAVEGILLERAVVSGAIAVVPARPVVLGGDDLTILVRADLALPFAVRLLEGIEQPVVLQGEPRRLSACAGVAIVRKGLPFLTAHSLAESLCSFAKKAAKHDRPTGPYPSMLAFHNAVSTLRETYEDDDAGEGILAREKTARDGELLRLTGNPYLVGTLPEGKGGPVRPRFEALVRLAEALGSDPRGLGKLIELAHYVAAVPQATHLESWRRWREVLSDRDRGALEKVDQALNDGFSVVASDETLPIAEADEGERLRRYLPIADALELIDLKAVATAET